HVRTRHRSCIRLFPSPRRHPHLFVLFSHPPSSPDIYTLSLHDALPICPETSPSIPSVKFTALEKPTNQKIANSVYNTNPKCNSCPNNAKDNGSFSCTKTNTKRSAPTTWPRNFCQAFKPLFCFFHNLIESSQKPKKPYKTKIKVIINNLACKFLVNSPKTKTTARIARL